MAFSSMFKMWINPKGADLFQVMSVLRETVTGIMKHKKTDNWTGWEQYER